VLSREGLNTYLKLRVTNVIGNDIVNVIPSLFVQKINTSKSGEVIRSLIPVKLETTTIPIAAFSWILVHKLDRHSPLKSWVSGCAKNDERLLGFIYGFDSTINNASYSFAKWSPTDLVEGDFDNVIINYSETSDLRSKVVMDLSKIDKVI